MKLKPLYFIVLEDDTTFVGGTDISDTKWMQIPNNKKIKRVFYSVSDNDSLCLSGYDSYFHKVEICQDLNGDKRGQVRPQNTCIMGKKDNLVTCYKIDFNSPRNIEKQTYDINSDFVQSLNETIWK